MPPGRGPQNRSGSNEGGNNFNRPAQSRPPGSRPPFQSSRPPFNRDRDDNRERENQNSDGPRVNRQVRAPEVRVIGPDGEMLGVMSSRDAMMKAQEFGLDLVEVNPAAAPPVCKILDYGKYKYEEQKKKKEAKKKQKVIEVKEIKLRPMIGEHDLQIKIRMMHEFLAEGDKVKISMRFRGREAANQKIGFEVMQKIIAGLADVGKPEADPKMEGGGMLFLMMVPAK